MKKICLCLLLVLGLYACDSSVARRPVSATSTSFVKFSAEKNHQLLKKEQKLIDSIIASDTLHQFETSKAGFRFYYLKRTDGQTVAQQGDIVRYRSQIFDLDGNEIYPERKNEEQIYRVDKQKVFLGFQYAIKLLKEGEQAVFYFPSSLAYAYFGDRDKIGANQPIIFSIEVLEIKKNNN